MKDIREIDKSIESFSLNHTDKNRFLLYINFKDSTRINIFLELSDVKQLLNTIKYHLE